MKDRGPRWGRNVEYACSESSYTNDFHGFVSQFGSTIPSAPLSRIFPCEIANRMNTQFGHQPVQATVAVHLDGYKSLDQQLLGNASRWTFPCYSPALKVSPKIELLSQIVQEPRYLPAQRLCFSVHLFQSVEITFPGQMRSATHAEMGTQSIA